VTAEPDVTLYHMARPAPDAIAEAALRVLGEGGPHALSFRRVAALLGTSHMTVHRYCGNVDGLLDLCAEHLAAGLPDVDPDLPWAEASERRFASLYDVMSAHPGLVALQQGRPWLGPEMMRRFSEPAVASSLDAGLSLDEMVRAHRVLFSFTVGCALTHEAYDASRARAVLDGLDPEATPVLAAQRHRFEGERMPRRDYLQGLRALIAAVDPSTSS
jgi:AcrR family transcriptional regulator